MSRAHSRTPLWSKGAIASRTPARGTAVSERNSGAASSNRPRYAISRSTRRSDGSLSNDSGTSSSTQKADRFGPHPSSQPLAHGPLADTKPARDLAVGMAPSLEPLHASRERHTRPSLRIAAGLAQRGHPAVFKTLFVPAYRASRTVERPRYVVLIGPALLNQIDPRMRLRDAIAHGVVGQHNPGNHHHAPAVLGAQQTSIIDCTRALRATRNRE